jgi:hypothetical protein
MDTVIWTTVREELSCILTRLIGEEVYLSEEEAQRVVERLCPRDASTERKVRESADFVGVG